MDSQPRETARVQKAGVALCAMVLALTVSASPATADTFTGINLFGVPSGNLNLQATSGNQLLTFFDTAGGFQNAAFVVAGTPVSFGVYMIGSSAKGTLQTLPGGGAQFLMPVYSPFGFADYEADKLSGTIAWTAVTEMPKSLLDFIQLEGILSYSVGSSSSEPFKDVFGGSGSLPIDVNGQLGCSFEPCTLAGLAARGDAGLATMGNSTLAPVPEPASVILLGLGLAPILATASKSRAPHRRFW
jgi:hypothetical protein